VPHAGYIYSGGVAAHSFKQALDRGYERLQTLHSVRYACPRCSEEKEQRRLGLRRG